MMIRWPFSVAPVFTALATSISLAVWLQTRKPGGPGRRLLVRLPRLHRPRRPKPTELQRSR